MTAATATSGTTDNINKVNLILSVPNKMTPPMIKMNCLKNSAMVVVKVSCICEMSALIRLFNSPTRLCEKKDMGNFTRLLYKDSRRLAKVCSVKLTNKDTLKKEKMDCKNKIPINNKAMLLTWE